jgi:uncharacterized protein YjlB
VWVALQSAWASLRTRPLSSDISRIDEESFILLEGEIEATLRGVKSAVKEGNTVLIPANVPHQFHNTSSDSPVYYASALLPGRKSSSQRLASRSRPGRLPLRSWTRQLKREFRAKAEALARKYRTAVLRHA